MRFSRFRPDIPFSGKSGQENRDCEFKLKFDTKTNLKMQNSMVIFTFFRFFVELPLLGKLGPKNQICNLTEIWCLD